MMTLVISLRWRFQRDKLDKGEVIPLFASKSIESMRWVVLIISLSIFPCQGYTQKLINLYNNYQYSVKQEDFEKAVIALKEIEKKAINKNFYRYKIIYFSYLSDDSITFFNYIRRFDTQDSLQLSELLKNEFSRYPNWKNELFQSKTTHLNMPVASILENLYAREVLHRGKINLFYQQLRDSLINYEKFQFITDSLFKLQNPIDSLNHIQYKKLIDSIGYIPGYDELSIQQVRIHFIILQHIDNNTKKAKYVRMFRNGVKKGVLPSSYYIQIIDRYRAGVGKKLLFGSSVKINEKGEKIINGKLLPIKKVNRNRIKFGLGTI